jgi:DNA-binding protein WhiA
VADLRGQANRLANADHANLVRQSQAARRDIDAARKLKRDGTLARLRGPLQEAAELRLRYPEDPLRELAARAAPPTTKAAMQRRLARLRELAGE